MGAFQVTLGVVVAAFWAVRMIHQPRRERRASMNEAEGGLYVAVMSGVALLQVVSLALAIFAPDWIAWSTLPLPSAVRAFGAVLCVIALLGLIAIHRALGANYHSVLHLREDHQLITNGPYSRVRHPMYTALYLVFVGFGVLSANLLVAASHLVGLTIIVARRIPNEERLLLSRFGADYREYLGRTNRFLP